MDRKRTQQCPLVERLQQSDAVCKKSSNCISFIILLCMTVKKQETKKQEIRHNYSGVRMFHCNFCTRLCFLSNNFRVMTLQRLKQRKTQSFLFSIA